MKKYITYQIHYYIFIYTHKNSMSGYYDSNITIPQPK